MSELVTGLDLSVDLLDEKSFGVSLLKFLYDAWECVRKCCGPLGDWSDDRETLNARTFYSKNTMCGKQLYSELMLLLHLIIR